MLPLLIKYFFIVYSTYYCYSKLSNLTYRKYISLLISFTISLVTSSALDMSAAARIIFVVIIMYLSLSITQKSLSSKILVKLLISYILSFAIFFLSATLTNTIFIFIYQTATNIPGVPIRLVTGFTQILICFCLLKSKRFCSGMILITNNTNIIFKILLLCLLVISISLLVCLPAENRYDRIIVSFSFILFSIFLLYYWRYRITQTYREKLRIANEKSLVDELHNQRERIADLEADNARLSQIVHKDNKIILAMLTAVTEHLENTIGSTPEELTIQGMELSAQLQDMAKERQGILNTQTGQINILPKSGLHTVDGMLSFMETRAKEAEITYKLQIEENIKEIASNAILEADLLHLLGDLIDNAIIATKHANDKHEILIHLGTLQNHFLLEISDSGIPFSLDTYQSFGNEPHTTHRNDGGSGIGLMDIWKLKKKYKASLHIYEYEEGERIYTKKLTFIFDCKNHFFLQTPRYKEATYALTRGDLYIFPNKDE